MARIAPRGRSNQDGDQLYKVTVKRLTNDNHYLVQEIVGPGVKVPYRLPTPDAPLRHARAGDVLNEQAMDAIGHVAEVTTHPAHSTK